MANEKEIATSADDFDEDKHSLFELGEVNLLSSSSFSMSYETVGYGPQMLAQHRVSRATCIVDNKFEIELTDEDQPTLFGKFKRFMGQFKGLLFGLLAAFLLSLSNVILRKTKFFSGSDHALVRYTISFVFLFIHIKRNNIELFPKSNIKILLFRGFIGKCS
jgi:hypothetical protein